MKDFLYSIKSQSQIVIGSIFSVEAGILKGYLENYKTYWGRQRERRRKAGPAQIKAT